ncbi:MAG TPA: hypothetical protein VFP98_09720, partial [Candidatus Polarisedimenticolia bacterium]|nr:hypothetical protein [Candidatus Polarisedimenticolia bacterium]
IRRVARPGYRPLNFVSLELKEQALPFVPTYEGPWSNYLDGKLTREQAIEGMLGALVPPESHSAGGSTPVP